MDGFFPDYCFQFEGLSPSLSRDMLAGVVVVVAAAEAVAAAVAAAVGSTQWAVGSRQ